jgi:galactoside 2-L-fucosyltransferase 1/2
VTYVGIHNRRTDYLDFRRDILKRKKLYNSFFFDAMDYYRDEFDNVVFVYVSDDMEWGRKRFRKSENVFFVGCGNSEDPGKSLFNELYNFLICRFNVF